MSPLSQLVYSCAFQSGETKVGSRLAPWRVPEAPSAMPQPVAWDPEGGVHGNTSVLCFLAEIKFENGLKDDKRESRSIKGIMADQIMVRRQLEGKRG